MIERSRSSRVSTAIPRQPTQKMIGFRVRQTGNGCGTRSTSGYSAEATSDCNLNFLRLHFGVLAISTTIILFNTDCNYAAYVTVVTIAVMLSKSLFPLLRGPAHEASVILSDNQAEEA